MTYEFATFQAPEGCPQPQLAAAAARFKAARLARRIFGQSQTVADLAQLQYELEIRLMRAEALDCPLRGNERCADQTVCRLGHHVLETTGASADDTAADHPLAIIDDGRLPGGDGPDSFI